MLPPNMKLTRVAGPASEPISVAQARQYLRLETTDEDDLIGDLIAAARIVVESTADRCLIASMWRLTLDYLPFAGVGGVLWPALTGLYTGRRRYDDGAIELPMPPLIGLESITYVDQGGTTRNLDVSPGSPEVVVSPGTPGRITAGYGRVFPFARPTIGAVEITYTSGFGPDPADVPRNYSAAVRLLVSHLYEHRTEQAAIPDAVASLIGPKPGSSYA